MVCEGLQQRTRLGKYSKEQDNKLSPSYLKNEDLWNFRNSGLGAYETAQLVKCKHEDLGLNTPHICLKPMQWSTDGETGSLMAGKACQIRALGSVKVPVSKRKSESNWERHPVFNLWPLHKHATCEHAPTPTHTHTFWLDFRNVCVRLDLFHCLCWRKTCSAENTHQCNSKLYVYALPPEHSPPPTPKLPLPQ